MTRTEYYIRDEIRVPGYFATTVEADGPWEARFRFCGEFGCNPADVKVSPPSRAGERTYWCVVGKVPAGTFLINSPLMMSLTQP